jgi:hypothetical protein
MDTRAELKGEMKDIEEGSQMGPTRMDRGLLG